MKKTLALLIVLCSLLALAACNYADMDEAPAGEEPSATDGVPKTDEVPATDEVPTTDEVIPTDKEPTSMDKMKLNIQIGDATFTATLEDNAAVRELIEMMNDEPVTIDMRDYSGFEKVGPLGRNLTTDNHQTTTTAGDIVLYNGNQIVMFYGSNAWSYTRIGRIDDLSGWEEALGSGSITAVFSLDTDAE